MDQRRIHPLDVIRLTHDEYGWSNTEVQVISVVQLRDRTAVCLCRRYNSRMFEATLSLPGIPKRPAARWPLAEIPLDLTGLRARDRLDIRHDAIRNWTDVFWDPKVVAGTEVEYQIISERRFPLSARLIVTGSDPVLTLIQAIESESGRAQVRGVNPTTTSFNRYLADSGRAVVRGSLPHAASGRSIFDSSVSLNVNRGIYFRQTGLKPLSIASSDATNQYGIDQTNRWGDWLNYQGVPNSAALPFRQLAFERGARTGFRMAMGSRFLERRPRLRRSCSFGGSASTQRTPERISGTRRCCNWWVLARLGVFRQTTSRMIRRGTGGW